jgi:hypothetical protein
MAATAGRRKLPPLELDASLASSRGSFENESASTSDAGLSAKQQSPRSDPWFIGDASTDADRLLGRLGPARGSTPWVGDRSDILFVFL